MDEGDLNFIISDYGYLTFLTDIAGRSVERNTFLIKNHSVDPNFLSVKLEECVGKLILDGERIDTVEFGKSVVSYEEEGDPEDFGILVLNASNLAETLDILVEDNLSHFEETLRRGTPLDNVTNTKDTLESLRRFLNDIQHQEIMSIQFHGRMVHDGNTHTNKIGVIMNSGRLAVPFTSLSHDLLLLSLIYLSCTIYRVVIVDNIDANIRSEETIIKLITGENKLGLVDNQCRLIISYSNDYKRLDKYADGHTLDSVGYLKRSLF